MVSVRWLDFEVFFKYDGRLVYIFCLLQCWPYGLAATSMGHRPLIILATNSFQPSPLCYLQVESTMFLYTSIEKAIQTMIQISDLVEEETIFWSQFLGQSKVTMKKEAKVLKSGSTPIIVTHIGSKSSLSFNLKTPKEIVFCLYTYSLW